MALLDSFEVLGYFTFFWLFIFKKQFREIKIVEWKEGNVGEKFLIVIEAISSIFCGLFIPGVILWVLFSEYLIHTIY
jgi:hypothetical protein